MPPVTCTHPKLRSVTLILRGGKGTPEGVSVSVSCADCKKSFRFIGIETNAAVLVSEDRTEVRLLIEEEE